MDSITFWTLETVNRSRAELDALNARVFRQPVLLIDLNLKEGHLKNDDHRYIVGSVSIKNIGKKNTILKFHDKIPIFTATEISFDGDGKILTGKQYSQIPPKYGGYVIRVGATKKIPFYLQVGKPDLYFVDFEVEISTQKNTIMVTIYHGHHLLILKSKNSYLTHMNRSQVNRHKQFISIITN